jgi:hypothetical protein
MGTYLTVYTKIESDRAAKQANNLWIREYPEEEEEKDYKENFYGLSQGYTLRFATQKDVELDAIYFRDDGRADLGFKPDMTVAEAVKQYQKVFGSYARVGRCQIKLSGEHYCGHKLIRVQRFLEKYGSMFDIEGFEDLEEYVNDPTGWISSAYCKACKEEAEKFGVYLPVNANQGSKSNRGFIDSRGRDVTEICKNATSFYSVAFARGYKKCCLKNLNTF